MGKTSASGSVLTLEYVPVDSVKLWERNPKEHDLDAIVASIIRHGFSDAPVHDARLDRIIAGNGRTTAVRFIRDNPDEVQTICELHGIAWDGKPPERIQVDKDGQWLIPVQFGLRSKNDAEAWAFGIAHNNLTMQGGNASALDLASMWDSDAYMALLEDLQMAEALPVGLTDEDVEELRSLLDHVPSLDELEREHGETGEEDNWPTIRLKVDPVTFDEYEKLMEAAPGSEEHLRFANLIQAVDYAALSEGELA